MKYALLTPLRGLAALWVFMFHLGICETYRSRFPVLAALCGAGHLGVPMFFVISGYCLTASAESAAGRGESAWSFMRRRLVRIYPPLWLSIVVIAILPFASEALSSLKTGQFVAPRADEHRYLDFGWTDWFSYASLVQVFSPGSGSGFLEEKFSALNSVYWTLAVELQFYFVITAALACGRNFHLVIAAVTVLSVPASFSSGWYDLGIFLPYWPMFALGITVFYLLDANTPRQLLREWPIGRFLSLGGLFIIVGLFVATIARGGTWPPLAFAAAFASALVLASGWDSQASGVMQQKTRYRVAIMWLPFLMGEMSYSIYLLHGKIHFLAAQVLRQAISPESICFQCFVIVGTCALCYPFYRCCEAPFVRARV